jgi:amidase
VNADDLTATGAAALSELIHAREVSCREVMTAFLDRIDARNPDLNAIVSRRDRDVLMREAAERDEELVAGESRGWMHGIPQAIKRREGWRRRWARHCSATTCRNTTR